MIYIPSTGYTDISIVDPTTLKTTIINSDWVNVAIATEAGQLLDYTGNTQTINTGDLLFISKGSLSILSTLFDFVTTVVFKDVDSDTTNSAITSTAPTTMNITLTGVATTSAADTTSTPNA